MIQYVIYFGGVAQGLTHGSVLRWHCGGIRGPYDLQRSDPDDYMQGKHLATFSKLLYKPIYLIIVFKFKGTKVTIP